MKVALQGQRAGLRRLSRYGLFTVWSAGLQTGTGDRTKLGTCAALESGAP